MQCRNEAFIVYRNSVYVYIIRMKENLASTQHISARVCLVRCARWLNRLVRWSILIRKLNENDFEWNKTSRLIFYQCLVLWYVWLGVCFFGMMGVAKGRHYTRQLEIIARYLSSPLYINDFTIGRPIAHAEKNIGLKVKLDCLKNKMVSITPDRLLYLTRFCTVPILVLCMILPKSAVIY